MEEGGKVGGGGRGVIHCAGHYFVVYRCTIQIHVCIHIRKSSFVMFMHVSHNITSTYV